MTDDTRHCLAHGSNPYPARRAKHGDSARAIGVPLPRFDVKAAEDDA
jgi:hypothetical protein